MKELNITLPDILDEIRAFIFEAIEKNDVASKLALTAFIFPLSIIALILSVVFAIVSLILCCKRRRANVGRDDKLENNVNGIASGESKRKNSRSSNSSKRSGSFSQEPLIDKTGNYTSKTSRTQTPFDLEISISTFLPQDLFNEDAQLEGKALFWEVLCHPKGVLSMLLDLSPSSLSSLIQGQPSTLSTAPPFSPAIPSMVESDPVSADSLFPMVDVVSVMGEYNAGKTRCLGRIFGQCLPNEGTISQTAALGYKWVKENGHVRWLLLDTAGTARPLARQQLFHVKDLVNLVQYTKGVTREVDPEKLIQDKKQVEHFVRMLIYRQASILLYVVNDVKWSVQEEINSIRNYLKAAKSSTLSNNFASGSASCSSSSSSFSSSSSSYSSFRGPFSSGHEITVRALVIIHNWKDVHSMFDLYSKFAEQVLNAYDFCGYVESGGKFDDFDIPIFKEHENNIIHVGIGNDETMYDYNGQVFEHVHQIIEKMSYRTVLNPLYTIYKAVTVPQHNEYNAPRRCLLYDYLKNVPELDIRFIKSSPILSSPAMSSSSSETLLASPVSSNLLSLFRRQSWFAKTEKNISVSVPIRTASLLGRFVAKIGVEPALRHVGSFNEKFIFTESLYSPLKSYQQFERNGLVLKIYDTAGICLVASHDEYRSASDAILVHDLPNGGVRIHAKRGPHPNCTYSRLPDGEDETEESPMEITGQFLKHLAHGLFLGQLVIVYQKRDTNFGLPLEQLPADLKIDLKAPPNHLICQAMRCFGLDTLYQAAVIACAADDKQTSSTIPSLALPPINFPTSLDHGVQATKVDSTQTDKLPIHTSSIPFLSTTLSTQTSISSIRPTSLFRPARSGEQDIHGPPPSYFFETENEVLTVGRNPMLDVSLPDSDFDSSSALLTQFTTPTNATNITSRSGLDASSTAEAAHTSPPQQLQQTTDNHHLNHGNVSNTPLSTNMEDTYEHVNPSEGVGPSLIHLE